MHMRIALDVHQSNAVQRPRALKGSAYPCRNRFWLAQLDLL